MNDVRGSTKEEVKLIKAIQKATGAYDNGYIGNQTLSDIDIELEADCFPLNVELYGMPTIISKNIVPFIPNSVLSNNCISGSFNDGYQPCSILVQNGLVKCWSSCHYPEYSETVIYKDIYGNVRCDRITHISNTNTIKVSEIDFAVGGMGLLGLYSPKEEGFVGKFSDVLRKTNHTVLGYRNGMFYGVYFKNMTASQINKMCSEKFKFQYAILLDGGHIAAINGEVNKINVYQKQLYAIKFY